MKGKKYTHILFAYSIDTMKWAGPSSVQPTRVCMYLSVFVCMETSVGIK